MPTNSPGSNSKAIERTIKALLAAHKLDVESDAARIEAARTLARLVDSDDGNASLWREYRATEAELHEVRDAGSDDEQALIDALSSEVRDPPQPRTPQSRTTSSRRR